MLLHEEHSELLTKWSQQRRVTKKSILFTALQNYLHPESKVSSEAHQMKLLRKLKEEALETKREVELLNLVISVFIKVWITHTKEVPDDERADVAAASETKIANFIKLLSIEAEKGSEAVLAKKILPVLSN